MPTAWATGLSVPSENIDTSPIANDFPSFNNLHFPRRSLPAGGFVRKLIFRLVVTASATSPISRKIAT